MKTLLPLALLCTSAFAMADVEIPKSEAQSIKSIDAQDARDFAAKNDGKLVRIRFNYRGSSVEVKPDGGATAELRIYRNRMNTTNDQRSLRWGGVSAQFPPEGVKWIQNVTTHEDSRVALYVIARLHNKDGTGTVEVLGRQVVTDFKGSRVTW